jgi:hypothetical protein
MKFNKLILASLVATALAGCYSDDDYTVYNGTGGGSSSSGSSDDKSFVTCNEDTNVCTLEGVINENYTLDPDRSWRIRSWTFVGEGNVELANTTEVQAAKNNGVTLTIPAGVELKAYSDAVLVVTRGSKLNAIGTKSSPITFSSLDTDYDGEGEWGGVIVQGFAPQYGQGDTGICGVSVCNVEGEGGTEVGMYGGLDAADNSGTLKYVRITEGGKVAGPNNEINGLTLQGVGYGTTIEYIQVHSNLDDAIEWFGGTVNVKYAVLTSNDDDDLDFDEGYQGNMQHVLIIKNPTKTSPSGTNDPRGIEGNSDSPKQTVQTHAAIANVTIVGNLTLNAGQPGVKLRGSVTTDLFNIAVVGFSSGCLEVKNSQLVDVSVDGFVCYDTALKNDAPQAGSIVVTAADLSFDSAYAVTNSEAVNNATTTLTPVNNGSGFVFDATDYAGAVDPDNGNATRNWWSGWTLSGTVQP